MQCVIHVSFSWERGGGEERSDAEEKSVPDPVWLLRAILLPSNCFRLCQELRAHKGYRGTKGVAFRHLQFIPTRYQDG